MKTREMTCIGCPLGCMLVVKWEENGLVVSGHTCPNGEKYAKKEVTDPRRIVTSTVRAIGGRQATLPVKTATDIPKDRIFDCVRALKDVQAHAPVRIGQVILENVCGTGVDIIAAQDLQEA